VIKELIIKNFEAHEKFRTKLDPYITSFVGATDAGKSTIIRAIQWVVMNRPLGDSFIRDENKSTYVGIKTEKGIVSRKKGKGINEYKINGQKLEAFGTAVPDEVKEFLKMGELNFQFQFDAPYWFMISPGEVSKQLNQIVDLEIIDNTLSRLGSKTRDGKSQVKVSQDRLDDLETELGQLSFVKSMVKEFDKLEELENKIETELVYLESLDTSIEEVGKNLSNSKTFAQAHTESLEVVKIGIRIQKRSKELDSLTELIKSIGHNTSIIDSEIPDIGFLISTEKELKKVDEFCTGLHRCITQIETEKENACLKEKEKEELEKELKKVMGKTCPLCGATIKS